VFEGRFRTGLFWANYDISRKTGEFLMLATEEPARPRVNVTVNWTPSLTEPN
jgi:hypothetical protein